VILKCEPEIKDFRTPLENLAGSTVGELLVFSTVRNVRADLISLSVSGREELALPSIFELSRKPKVIYRFSTIPIRTPVSFFRKKKKKNYPKIHMVTPNTLK
jgi:hypothetical protein